MAGDCGHLDLNPPPGCEYEWWVVAATATLTQGSRTCAILRSWIGESGEFWEKVREREREREEREREKRKRKEKEEREREKKRREKEKEETEGLSLSISSRFLSLAPIPFKRTIGG